MSTPGSDAQTEAESEIPIVRPWLGNGEARAAAEVVRSGWVAQGPQVAAFEQAVARSVGAEHAVAVTSCTTALHLALIALDIGPGDEVVVPSLSFIATANAARFVGATPVFADVDPATHNLTASGIARALSPQTRAVILVHQCGMPADIAPVQDLCRSFEIALIEDAACALGSTYRGRPIGGQADLATFSFHPRKIITTGEGGMVLSRRADLAARLRRLRDHGMSVSQHDRHASRKVILEHYLEVGFNFRMTDIQAAIGLVQLQKLDTIVLERRMLAARYQELLLQVPGLELPCDPWYGTTNHQTFWVVLPDDFPVSRNEVMQRMVARNIHPRRGVMAAHREAPYRGLGHRELPVTERVTDQSLLLPLFHGMSEDDQQRVVAVLASAAQGAPA